MPDVRVVGEVEVEVASPRRAVPERVRVVVVPRVVEVGRARAERRRCSARRSCGRRCSPADSSDRAALPRESRSAIDRSVRTPADRGSPLPRSPPSRTTLLLWRRALRRGAEAATSLPSPAIPLQIVAADRQRICGDTRSRDRRRGVGALRRGGEAAPRLAMPAIRLRLGFRRRRRAHLRWRRRALTSLRTATRAVPRSPRVARLRRTNFGAGHHSPS